MASSSKAVQSLQEQLKKELAGLKETVEPPSGFTISTKGKIFTLPDGRSDKGPLLCIILDWVTANIYFEGLYNPQEVKPPSCWAMSRVVEGIAPSPNAPKPQSELCSTCPQNEWGSKPGSKGKACKNTRRLLIARADSQDKNDPVYVLSVSPTGLKHFDKYINTLADNKIHPTEVITEISFDESEAFPTLRFSVNRAGKHDKLELMMGLRESGKTILMQEPKASE